jgi:hypothetical protein
MAFSLAELAWPGRSARKAAPKLNRDASDLLQMGLEELSAIDLA